MFRFKTMFSKIFGNYTKKNEKSRKEIIDKARRICQDTNTPGSVVEQLNSFVSQLQRQEPSRSKEVAEVDSQIMAILSEIQTDCMNRETDLALSHCKDLFTRAGLRSTVTPVKYNTDIHTPEEVLDHMIAKLNGQSKNLAREDEQLSAKLARDPYNAVIAANLEQVRAKAQAAQNQLAMLLDQNRRKAIIAGINAMADTERTILADESASDEQFQMSMNKLNDIMDRMKGRTGITEDGATTYYGTNVGAGSATVGSTQRTNYADQLGVSGQNGTRVNYAQKMGVGGSTQNAPMTGTAAGNATAASDPAEQNLKDVFANLDKTIENLEILDKYYDGRINDATEEFNIKKEQMRQLLIQRDNASAIDCVGLDGKIDKLSIELDTAETIMDDFANARATNAERLKLARRIKAKRDINDANTFLGDEFIKSAADSAMYIKRQTERANDDLDEAGATNAVADSVKAKTTSVSGGRAYGDSTSRQKDDNKYNDLKQRYGLS